MILLSLNAIFKILNSLKACKSRACHYTTESITVQEHQWSWDKWYIIFLHFKGSNDLLTQVTHTVYTGQKSYWMSDAFKNRSLNPERNQHSNDITMSIWWSSIKLINIYRQNPQTKITVILQLGVCICACGQTVMELLLVQLFFSL